MATPLIPLMPAKAQKRLAISPASFSLRSHAAADSRVSRPVRSHSCLPEGISTHQARECAAKTPLTKMTDKVHSHYLCGLNHCWFHDPRAKIYAS